MTGSSNVPDAPFHEFPVESYGVRVAVRTDDVALMGRLRETLPPGAVHCDANTVQHRLLLATRDRRHFGVRYLLRNGREPDTLIGEQQQVATMVDLELALAVLRADVQSTVALHAPDHIFVHAGVVGYQGRAIVVPGFGLTGKTTLVSALLDAGASYYSDEHAVLDAAGHVLPFPTPLAGRETPVPREPLPIGAVVFTKYVPGTAWQPRALTAGECSMKLLQLTVPGQERPDQSLRAIRTALSSKPLMIEGDRGDADALASVLLAEVDAATTAD